MSSERRPRGVLLAAIAAFVGGGSCDVRRSVAHPVFEDGGLLAHAGPVRLDALLAMNGMYDVRANEDRFGNERVVAWGTPGTVSLFAAQNAAYAVLRAGCLDGGTRVVLEGYWRYADADDTGLARLFVEPPALASALCNGVPAPDLVAQAAFAGEVGEGAAAPNEPMRVSFAQPLRAESERFVVGGHSGGCRTIDDCGASENSLEVIRLAPALGAELVELDTRLTRDRVPILFHDDAFGERLAKGTYCHGPVADFTLRDVRALCTLRYGEQVPTVEEALRTVQDETRLRGAWLDVKDPADLPILLRLVDDVQARVRNGARPFDVVLGLGTRELVDAWSALGHPRAACLVELDPADVRSTGCRWWAPRWTLGPRTDDVRALQDEGHGVIPWTLDDPSFVDLFLTEPRIANGILTEREGLVMHRFQTRARPETIPPPPADP